MPITRAVGADGSIGTGAWIAAGGNGTHDGIIRTWSAQFPRISSNVTGFAATVLQANRLGLINLSGSLAGVPCYDAATTSPGVKDRAADGTSTILQVAPLCTYTIIAAYTNIAFSVDKTGDNVLTADFENGVTDTLTETWDETP